MSAKILVVDDEPNTLRLLGYALQSEGFEVITAQTGAQCLDQVADQEPDLVILDVMMPDMSGIETCQQIREMPGRSTLPIIMLSARAQTPDKVAGLRAGADEYVTKPFEIEEVVVRVERLLERTRLLRAEQQTAPGRVLGFIGAKGGVGTTTVALNVAAALAGQEKQVAAVELRTYYGTFSAQLNEQPNMNLRGLLDLSPDQIDGRALGDHLIASRFGVHLLYGPQRVDDYRLLEADHVEAILDGCAAMADIVVVDLPGHPSAANWAAVRRCDYVILVTEPEPACLVAGRAILQALASWGVRAGRVGVVAVNRGGSASVMGLAEVREELGCDVIGLVPPMVDACLAARRLSVPVVVANPSLVASANLVEIANRLGADQITPIQL